MGELRLTATIPWTRSWSKNVMWRRTAKGGTIRTYLNPDSEQARDELVLLLKSQLRGRTWPEAKTWVRIHCQRDDMRRDPINVIDLVADAIAIALGVDDRWFSVVNDWELIRRQPPTITVTVEAEKDDGSQLN